MGVPKLFMYLYKKYNQITYVNDNVNSNVNKIKSKYPIILYFDFNCLIHPIVHNVLNDENLNNTILNENELYALIFTKIKNYTDRIIDLFDSNILFKVYIVLDGVAPRAKMNQQRIRRFLSIKNNSEVKRIIFDTNCISPGTDFMLKLSLFLNKCYDNQNINVNKVLISDTLDPGEAEHKIMNIIRYNNDKINHIIYGLDADLIMLSLASNKTIKLLRENTLFSNNNEKSPFLLYHISGVKNSIINDMKTIIDSNLHSKINNMRVIQDYIYLTYFIGNDFIPNIKYFEIKNNYIDYILSIYCELFNKYNGDFFILDKFSIQNTNLVELFNELHDIYIIDHGIDIINLDERNNYYKNKLDISNNISNDKLDVIVRKMCNSYLKSTLWNLQYYYRGCQSYSWCYKYHYPPLLNDIISYLFNNTISSKFIRDLPVSSDIQLLCILPKESKHIVKQELQYIFEKYPEYYPSEYTIDLNGKQYEHEAVIKLPFIDIEILKKEIKK